MKIFFSPFKKLAYKQAMQFMFWNPEYSSLDSYYKKDRAKRLMILHKKDKKTIDEAKVNLVTMNNSFHTFKLKELNYGR